MKLEFSTKLNNIREKRRLRSESANKQTNNVNNITSKDNTNKHNMEDKNLLLKKLHFMNNPSSQKHIQTKMHSYIPLMNTRNNIKREDNDNLNIQNNDENIFIIVEELISCAKIKFYE